MIDPIALRSLTLGVLHADTDRDRRVICREILAMADAEIEAQQERALSAAVEALSEARQHGAPWAAQDTADQIRRAGNAT